MGIDRMVARFLLAAPRAGVDFSQTLTVGRQALYASEAGLTAELKRVNHSQPRSQAREMLAGDGYAEPLLKLLGAKRVDSVDASGYEQVTLTHDLNHPVPAAWGGSYSAVVDSGSLEHIFDITSAARNYMELVAPGGHLLFAHPANDQIGHGFYQLSPEFFFGLLSEEAGFRVVRLYLLERGPRQRWFRAPNPADLGDRLVVRSRWPTDVFVLAQRLDSTSAVTQQSPPQQHFYRAMWAGGSASGHPGGEAKGLAVLKRLTPSFMRRAHRLMAEYRATPNLARRMTAVDVTLDLAGDAAQ